MSIWILEDNADRIAVMQACLRDRLGIRTPPIFQTAPWFIAQIEEQLSKASLISLDHDLEDIICCDGSVFNPGTGRDAADFLAKRQPVCPVIIHSTNVPAAIGMEMALQESGWQTTRITPYDDTEWIKTIWIETVEELLGDISESVKAWPHATLELAEEFEQEVARFICDLDKEIR